MLSSRKHYGPKCLTNLSHSELFGSSLCKVLILLSLLLKTLKGFACDNVSAEKVIWDLFTLFANDFKVEFIHGF
jgi:hypothetical protein